MLAITSKSSSGSWVYEGLEGGEGGIMNGKDMVEGVTFLEGRELIHWNIKGNEGFPFLSIRNENAIKLYTKQRAFQIHYFALPTLQ